MDKVRFGIIGVGNMGSGHLKSFRDNLVPGGVLTAIADLKEDRRAFAKGEMPGIEVFDDAEKMMDSGLIDAVIIAVPHYYHPLYSEMALKKNIHVMCEKPIAVYTKAVHPVLEAAKNSDAIFAMMFNQRTNCLYRKMKEIVESGELGEIKRTSWIITDWYRTQAYYDSGAWRATWAGEGGGVLLNQCPHQLDMFQWICGMPVKVSAHLHEGKWHDIEVEDDVTAYLEYPNGATGVFITTTGDFPGTNRFEVDLDGGKLVCENGKLQMWKLKEPCSVTTKTCQQGFARPDFEYVPEVETDGENLQHVGVLRAFVGAILRGEPLVAKGEEGIRGLTLSNAMHLSSWLGRPVELPLDEDLYLAELNKRRATSRHKDDSGIVFDTEGSY